MSIDEYKIKIAAQLRMERRLREISQRQVAEAIGVHQRSVMLGERGEVSLDIMYAYAEWLGLDWSTLTSVACEAVNE